MDRHPKKQRPPLAHDDSPEALRPASPEYLQAMGMPRPKPPTSLLPPEASQASQ